MSDAWLDPIVTLLAAVVGWGLAELSRVLNDRRRARTELAVTAIGCLDRLEKIKGAIARTNNEQCNYEKHLLGSDLDRYRNCIGAAHGKKSAHWHAYETAMPILLQDDFERIGNVVEEFKSLTGVTR